MVQWVLFWITYSGFGLNHSFWVLVWITDSGFIGGGWLQSCGFVCWVWMLLLLRHRLNFMMNIRCFQRSFSAASLAPVQLPSPMYDTLYALYFYTLCTISLTPPCLSAYCWIFCSQLVPSPEKRSRVDVQCKKFSYSYSIMNGSTTDTQWAFPTMWKRIQLVCWD